jgi:molybdopterin-guanine dinucleotide biosynthesis protein A
MGQDKAVIKLAGRPLITHVLDKVSDLGEELVIVSNSPEQFDLVGVRFVADEVPGQGALQGLETALTSAKYDPVLVLACDLPFVSRSLVEHMLKLSPEGDLIIPVLDGKYEPMHAVYSKRCLPLIRQALATGEKRVTGFFESVTIVPISERDLLRYDPEGLSFFNVNTPQDLEEAERIYATFFSQGTK